MATYQTSLKIKQKVFGANSLPAAKTLQNIGTVHLELGQFREAHTVFQNSLTVMTTHLGPDHAELATVWYNIGEVELALHRVEDALKSFRQCLHIRWTVFGGKDKRVTRVLRKIACLELLSMNLRSEEVEDDWEDEDSEDDRYEALHSEVEQAIRFVNTVQQDMAMEVDSILMGKV